MYWYSFTHQSLTIIQSIPVKLLILRENLDIFCIEFYELQSLHGRNFFEVFVYNIFTGLRDNLVRTKNKI